MKQDVDHASVGYAIKRAQAALHTAMETTLRDLGIGVSQYSCLVALAHRPGISNADLARAVFVSRQATHRLLAGLMADGLVEVSGEGRGARLALSEHAVRVLDEAQRRVLEVEARMLATIPDARRAALRDELNACADALEPGRDAS